MDYQSFLENQKKSDLGKSFNIAEKTKNIDEIGTLADKGLVCAIEKMISYYSKKNDDNGTTIYTDKLLQSVPDECKMEALDKANKIVNTNTPKYKLAMSN